MLTCYGFQPILSAGSSKLKNWFTIHVQRIRNPKIVTYFVLELLWNYTNKCKMSGKSHQELNVRLLKVDATEAIAKRRAQILTLFLICF